jgi:hypothetical protein
VVHAIDNDRPALVWMRIDHWVVVYGYSASYFCVADPSLRQSIPLARPRSEFL